MSKRSACQFRSCVGVFTVLVLARYGVTQGTGYEHGDLALDSDMDLSDLAALPSVYGTTCE